MALITLTDVDGSGKPATRKLGSFPVWTALYVQVQGPATVRLSNSQQELAQNAPGGALQGLQINQNTNGGLPLLWWRGDLWAVASAPTPVEVIELGPGVPGL